MNDVFHRDFDREIEDERCASLRAPLLCHSTADLDRAVCQAQDIARAEGYAAGHAVGVGVTEAACAAQHAKALTALAGPVEALLAQAATHRAALEAEVQAFILDICERVFPDILRATSTTRAAEQMRHALTLTLGQPHLTIRLSPETHIALAAELRALAGSGVGARQIDVTPDPALANGDVVVTWADGFLRYSFDDICNGILAALRGAPETAPQTLIRKVV
ncbi:hypothetical protein EYC08_17450 [Tabrizicola sp. WMC-M-20]|nr:hypothetical protein EYC08_17450 [Tabrizicola sp. WMC-M-20]